MRQNQSGERERERERESRPSIIWMECTAVETPDAAVCRLIIVYGANSIPKGEQSVFSTFHITISHVVPGRETQRDRERDRDETERQRERGEWEEHREHLSLVSLVAWPDSTLQPFMVHSTIIRGGGKLLSWLHSFANVNLGERPFHVFVSLSLSASLRTVSLPLALHEAQPA